MPKIDPAVGTILICLVLIGLLVFAATRNPPAPTQPVVTVTVTDTSAAAEWSSRYRVLEDQRLADAETYCVATPTGPTVG